MIVAAVVLPEVKLAVGHLSKLRGRLLNAVPS